MTKIREKKREKAGQGTGWLDGVLDLLRGGALGAACAIAVLAVSAVLVSFGIISNDRTQGAVVAACLLGGLVGGVFAVGRRKSAPLPTGLGAGGILFLLLLTAGVLVYDAPIALESSGVVAGACLCGGGLAGVLGSKTKRKKRK